MAEQALRHGGGLARVDHDRRDALGGQRAAPHQRDRLPLYVISGIFVPTEQLPSVLVTVADVFPVKPLFDAMLAAFALTAGSGYARADLAALAAWGAGGALLATALFAWTPRRT